MKNILLMLMVILLLPFRLVSQIPIKDCTKIQYGQFYYYPKDAKGEYYLIRKGDLHLEINLSNKDTAVYKVNWLNPCNYSLRFIRRSLPLERKEEAFLKGIETRVQILNISKGYYTFKAVGLDPITPEVSLIDTVWFNRR